MAARLSHTPKAEFMHVVSCEIVNLQSWTAVELGHEAIPGSAGKTYFHRGARTRCHVENIVEELTDIFGWSIVFIQGVKKQEKVGLK